MIPVVYSPTHREHAPRHEVNLGQPIPTFERPDRAERIREALVADAQFRFDTPTEHGLGPIEAVHEPGMVRFLETAWRDLHAQYGGEARVMGADHRWFEWNGRRERAVAALHAARIDLSSVYLTDPSDGQNDVSRCAGKS